MKTNENKTIHIGNKTIGAGHPTYIIAEIGINHNGDIKIAKELIDIAIDAKADAVKFQKRHLPSLYQEDVLTDTVKYEQNFQYMIPILKKVELKENEIKALKRYSEKNGIEFLCTPFDIKSAQFLNIIEVKAFKTSSADINNFLLIEYLAKLGKPIIASTGMSFWHEIEKTVEIIKKHRTPFALLHCKSVYPVWPREVNLKMINLLGRFDCPVGYSGHELGIIVPLVAASVGASIIEKHITLNKKMSGPDHKISLEHKELKRMIRDIRIADQAMGKENRFLLRGEVLNRELFGKSLTARENLTKGTKITKQMVNVIGPGKGLSPGEIDNLIGITIDRDIKKGDFFQKQDIDGEDISDFNSFFNSEWGLITRFADFKDIMSYNPDVIEFHLTANDLQAGFTPDKKNHQKLIVHAPEYIGEKLFDLCSGNEEIRTASVKMAQKTIDFTQYLSKYFEGVPKVIVHPGAMSLNTKLDKAKLKKALFDSLCDINKKGVELLFENLPPYPWYFGGQWKGNYFMNADEISSFCSEADINICFDLSHAALYCNAKNKSLIKYIKKVKQYIKHIHFADGYGLDGEGVQIGEGDIDFDEIMPLFDDFRKTGVLEYGRGLCKKEKGLLEACLKLKNIILSWG